MASPLVINSRIERCQTAHVFCLRQQSHIPCKIARQDFTDALQAEQIKSTFAPHSSQNEASPGLSWL